MLAVLTIAGIIAGIMFMADKHNLFQYYFISCLPCICLHLSIVGCAMYYVLNFYDYEDFVRVVQMKDGMNPFTLWITSWISTKFLIA